MDRGDRHAACWLQGAANDHKEAELRLAAATSHLSSVSAEYDQARILQEKLDHSAADCSNLAGALSGAEAHLAAQQALHQSIQGALFYGRKHAALDQFRNDLITAQREVGDLEQAMSVAQGTCDSWQRTVSSLKSQAEDLVNQPRAR